MKSKTVDGVTHAVLSEPDRKLWDRMLDSLVAFQTCENDNDSLLTAADVGENAIRDILAGCPRTADPPQPAK